MSEILTTDLVAQRERFAYWREMVCEVFVQLDCARLAGGPAFHGQLTTRRAGPLQVTDVATEAQHVVRSKRQIAKGREDDCLVSLQLTGEGFVLQDGREAHLKPGDFALYDSARPYDLHFDDEFSQLVLQMPRALLCDRLGTSDLPTAMTVSGTHGAGALVSGFLRSFAAGIDTMQPAVADRLAASAMDMLATGFWSLRAGGGPARWGPGTPGQTALRYAVKSFIEANLAQPDLSVAAVARAHGVSARYLRKLFDDEGTSPGRWIWDRRFARARADLADPTRTARSITEIAMSWGFNDLSHFSRGFRARFGRSPRAFRAAALGGVEAGRRISRPDLDD